MRVVPPPEPSIRTPLAFETTALLLKSRVSVVAAEVRASKALPVAARALLPSVADEGAGAAGVEVDALDAGAGDVVVADRDADRLARRRRSRRPRWRCPGGRDRGSPQFCRLPAVAGTVTASPAHVVDPRLGAGRDQGAEAGTVRPMPSPCSFWPFLQREAAGERRRPGVAAEDEDDVVVVGGRRVERRDRVSKALVDRPSPPAALLASTTSRMYQTTAGRRRCSPCRRPGQGVGHLVGELVGAGEARPAARR